MSILYNIGKIVLVMALVFQGYNEIINLKDQSKFQDSFLMAVQLANGALDCIVPYSYEIGVTLASLKLISSILVFCDSSFIVLFIILI